MKPKTLCSPYASSSHILLAQQYIMFWRDTSPYEACGIREAECTALPVFRKLHTGYIRM